MLVTLLVLWVVVVPALTLGGTYLLSGAAIRRGNALPEPPPIPVHIAGRHRAPIATRDHAGRSHGHTLIKH